MDGNKDEAFKCLKIAKDSIESGDRTRALKFLNKARRLDPSIAIDDFLSNLNASQPENEDPNQSTTENPFDPLRSGTQRRAPAAGSSSSSSSTSAMYTEEQITVVREIKKKKDYYQILGLEKRCSSEDIRKAYRKLSLKVHPDKNNAPGAEEAFKMVSKAFQCLSNEDNRKKYDVSGSDEPVYERRAGGGGFNDVRGFNGFHAGGDVDADEIFRNFFFGGMNPATTGNFGFSFGPGVRVRTGGADHGSNWARILIQLLPVLFFLLLNFMPSSEPIYSLQRSYSHNYRFTTQNGVNFYTKSANFEQQYPPHSPERSGFEQQVENGYYQLLEQRCRNEYEQVFWGYRRETPSCEAKKRFEAKVQ